MQVFDDRFQAVRMGRSLLVCVCSAVHVAGCAVRLFLPLLLLYVKIHDLQIADKQAEFLWFL
jgi:hypothetical protein